MTRALYVTCFSTAFALFGAVADAKPAVAVLGLEVTYDNGAVDPAATAAASGLTQALRDRVRSGTGPYDTAGGSDKELIDLKLLNECSTEAVACMAKIGGDLGAKYMLYGHLAKAGTSYRVSVVLFNVDGKTKVTSKNYDVPAADLAGGPKGKDTLVWARKIYGEMTGESSQGNVVVRLTGADHGTLLVQENGQWQPKGSITSGQGRASLPEGRYKIAVESEGFQRFEQTVTISSGQDTSVPVTLAPMPKVDPGAGSGDAGSGSGTPLDHRYEGTVSESGGRTGWKVGAYGASLVAVGLAGYWAYEYFSVQGAYNSTPGHIVDGSGNAIPSPSKSGIWDDGACSAAGGLVSGMGDNTKFKAACDANSTEKILIPATFGMALVASGLFYFAYRSDGEHAPSGATAGRRHRTRPAIALVPTMTPTGAGATFRLDW